jgi:hypothetical protein
MTDVSLQAGMLAVVALLLLMVIVLMVAIGRQVRAMRREAEAARSQLAKMDPSPLLFNGVQQLKDVLKALETIDKRLQKLEALEKVQISHLNVRTGVRP